MTAYSAKLALAALAGSIATLIASMAFSPASASPARLAGAQQLGSQAAEVQYYRPGHYGQPRGCRMVMRYISGRRILQRVCS